MNLFPKIILNLVSLLSHNSKISLMQNRRGVSNIIGSLIVLAVVASVGSVILFQGLNQINAFSYDLLLYDKEHINELREDIIFEHVRFDPSPLGTDLELYLANIGSVDSTIATVTVVQINNQELILRENPIGPNATILVEDHTKLTLTNANLSSASPPQWNSTEYGGPLATPNPVYKITVTTSKGNFFSTFASPFNT